MAIIDRKMILVALWVAATVSGLAVVWTTNETRSLISDLREFRTQANELKVAYGQYLLQERSLSSAARLESVAINQLGLRFPVDKDIRVLRR